MMTIVTSVAEEFGLVYQLIDAMLEQLTNLTFRVPAVMTSFSKTSHTGYSTLEMQCISFKYSVLSLTEQLLVIPMRPTKRKALQGHRKSHETLRMIE